MLNGTHLEDWNRDGFVVVRGLFSPGEVAQLREHYMKLRAQGAHPGDMVSDTDLKDEVDPLQKFPRMIHMHRWDDLSLQWLIDARLDECLSDLLGASPLAVQTMLYFKPPGARGQALHQDNFYLKAAPGNCAAAWLALDDCDEENGCMQIVPGSHRWPILCPTQADPTQSFTDVTVEIPNPEAVVAVEMAAGDVLFFNGSLVHGSKPNRSTARFRRALIGHYIEGRAQQVTEFDQPVLKMDGTAFLIEKSAGGGPCGVWVEKNGEAQIELTMPPVALDLHE